MSKSEGPSTNTQSTSDSYNTTYTVNRTFDNSGNTNLYFDSPNAGTNVPSNNNGLMIALGCVALAVLINKKG